jgi:hypothetical protein
VTTLKLGFFVRRVLAAGGTKLLDLNLRAIALSFALLRKIILVLADRAQQCHHIPSNSHTDSFL